MIKIYGRASARDVRKILFLLEELSLPYERLDYGRGFQPTNTAEFLALNPNGTIPVLVDADAVVWESHAILRYIADKYAPEAYYPKQQPTRAHVEQWLDWVQAEVNPAMAPLFFYHFLHSNAFTAQHLDDGERDCAKLFRVLDQQLAKTGAFVLGANLTIADCALGMVVHRWLRLPIEHPDVPNVVRYYDDLGKHPPYQCTVLIGMP